jgi:hypothetical protein
MARGGEGIDKMENVVAVSERAEAKPSWSGDKHKTMYTAHTIP